MRAVDAVEGRPRLARLGAMGYQKAVVKAQIGASGYGMIKLAIDKLQPESVPEYLFFEGPCMVQGWLVFLVGFVFNSLVAIFAIDDSGIPAVVTMRGYSRICGEMSDEMQMGSDSCLTRCSATTRSRSRPRSAPCGGEAPLIRVHRGEQAGMVVGGDDAEQAAHALLLVGCPGRASGCPPRRRPAARPSF